MAQNDDIKSAVGEANAAIQSVLPAIDKQLADTARVLALVEQLSKPDPELVAAAAQLRASTAELNSRKANLDADDAPQTPPAPPAT